MTCMLVHPVVLGPDNVPAVTDLAQAEATLPTPSSPLSDSREQIVSCTDLDTLTAWLDRSLTAAQVSDLFA